MHTHQQKRNHPHTDTHMYEHCLFFVEWLAKRLLASCTREFNVFYKNFFLKFFWIQLLCRPSSASSDELDVHMFVHVDDGLMIGPSSEVYHLIDLFA